MPIIKGFESTSYFKAFTLNSLATSIAIVFALTLKSKLNTFTDINGNKVTESVSLRDIFITFAVTFIATFIAYSLLHIVFGYGAGQFVS